MVVAQVQYFAAKEQQEQEMKEVLKRQNLDHMSVVRLVRWIDSKALLVLD
jgi:hypothetical protein